MFAGAVDLAALERIDPQLHNATVKQMEEFGQTPAQLFTGAHPARAPLAATADLVWPLASQVYFHLYRFEVPLVTISV